MLESLIGQAPAAPLDLSPFLPAMPVAVRAALDEARTGEGPLARWYRGDARRGRVGECLALANRTVVANETFGWLVGITAFEDDRQEAATPLRRRSFRDASIGAALDAIAAGIAGGRSAPARLWVTVEQLVARLPRVSPRLADAVPVGLASRLAIVRGVALRLAQKLGPEARAAVERARDRAVGVDRDALDEALIALAGGSIQAAPPADDVALLGRLLAAWRTSRDAELERAITSVGAAVARARGPVTARSKGELEGTWLALAAHADPADVDRLLDTPWPRQCAMAIARIRALGAFVPDPRIARAVVIGARRYEAPKLAELYRAVAEVAAASASPSLRPELDVLAAIAEEIHRVRYSRAEKDALVDVYRAIDAAGSTPADPELLAEAAQRDPGGALDALYAEVYAHPGELAPREVLADALQLAGDPRGELIALQLAGPATTLDSRAARRIEALLAQYGDAWTGPLPGVQRGTRRFERGFLVHAEVRVTDAILARARDRPEWRTIESLSMPVREHADLGALLARMPQLRRLATRQQTLRNLVSRGGGFPGIEVVLCDRIAIPPRRVFPDVQIVGGGHPDARGIEAVLREARELGVRALVLFAGAEAILRAIANIALGPPELRCVVGDWDGGFDAADRALVRIHRDEPTRADAMIPASASSWPLFEGLHSVGVKQLACVGARPARLMCEVIAGTPFALVD